MNILLLHAGGQTAFASEAVLAYGSLENLMASDLLSGIPNREKSLGYLWEAANFPEADVDAEDAEEAQQTEAEADGGGVVKPL